MTSPTLPPDCQVWVDGTRMADGGTPGETDTDPVVLTDLRVTWGRRNTLDQPEPSTCVFTVLDVGGGARALDRLNIGSVVDVIAAAVIPHDPTDSTITDPGFESAPVGSTPPSSTANATVTVIAGGAYGARSARIAPVDPRFAAAVIFPPAPFSADPSAWDALPVTLAGQAWHYGATLARLVQDTAGLPGVTVEVEPVGFTAPRADAVVRYAGPADRVSSPADAPAGWVILSGDTYPPDGVWMGLRVAVGYGPGWDDVGDALTWDALGGAPTLTNTATNPTPASTTGWGSNVAANWQHTYNATDKCVDIAYTAAGVAAYPNMPASWYNVGLAVANPVLTAGVKYQRSLEIWVEAAATLKNVMAGGFVGNVALAAGQWTRVVEQFTGSGTAQYVMAASVQMIGAAAGIRVKIRRAQLVANPTGQPVPYFDGSTPAAGGIVYAWTGAANASTSTATDTRPAPAWDDLGVALVDDLVMLAPAGGTQRRGSVFAGRITDLEARYDEGIGGTLVDVTAESHLAELGNRYVGDAPWAAESLGARFARIVAASGQPIAFTVDPGVAGYVVSWRDVDAQPAARLLAELAHSCAGALWLASSLTTGPYVWLEDIDARPATAVLVRTDHVVTIEPNPAGAGLLSLSACDVLLEPVRWIQTTEDDATRIAVRWLEQTTNTEGQPAPTERTLTLVDAGAEVLTGQRRLSLGTQLTTSADADRVGDAVLGRVRSPGWRVGGLTLALSLADPLDARTLTLAMTILDATSRIGAGLMLTDLPDWSPAGVGDIPLYLEGGRFSNVDGAWELELLTSDARAQGESGVAWDDVPATTAARVNPAYNPRNVAGGSGTWTATRGFGTGGAGTYSDITGISPAVVANVTTARRKTWTTAPTANGSSGLTVRQNTSKWFPVTAGEQITVSVYVRFAGAGTRTAQLIVQMFAGTDVGGEGSVISQPTSSTVTLNPGVWTRLSLTATVPAGANSCGVFADIVAGGTLWAVGNTLDGTAVLIDRAATAGPYFDGSVPTDADTAYVWNGTANASTSTATPLDSWLWDEFDDSITWNDLRGVGI